MSGRLSTNKSAKRVLRSFEGDDISFSDEDVQTLLVQANNKLIADDWDGLNELRQQIPSLILKHGKTQAQREQWQGASDRIDEMIGILSNPED